MASGDKRNKEIRKKLQNYLKAPSDALAAELREAGFVVPLSAIWPKLSGAKKKTPLDLLTEDASEAALQPVGASRLTRRKVRRAQTPSAPLEDNGGETKAAV